MLWYVGLMYNEHGVNGGYIQTHLRCLLGIKCESKHVPVFSIVSLNPGPTEHKVNAR